MLLLIKMNVCGVKVMADYWLNEVCTLARYGSTSLHVIRKIYGNYACSRH